ncbi:hypothetical protein BSZ22_02540 [Bradyrhizobium canariense]|uniref:Uncharacterized protein n=1 Tax=Bradyrhizobium canariense TaxID=255045 RepID=A0A1X3G6W0_9BRAD|nr:hypothetical protein BSZ22_02540 [Bradyrhizobium canariense]OSI82352.1 hypothetical protein BSZ23_01970 [Bradyrhizobium canariense]OSI96673.1 hypothetical protein BSZ25_01620 [Bradyrhizobium canariense]OSI98391.1 hypothetical protein BSZ24_01590 [Bradyrhizobium canariense]OSJ15815.1 hypothetical protein BSZ16_01685 [Bradyrhizobium canariense]
MQRPNERGIVPPVAALPLAVYGSPLPTEPASAGAAALPQDDAVHGVVTAAQRAVYVHSLNQFV